jgi:hypothetical protein
MSFPRVSLLAAATALIATAIAFLPSAAFGQSGPATFTGAVTETGCGSSNFADVPDNATIDVTVTADIPTNDIAVDLISGGNVLHHEDTGVGQETFAVTAAPAGTYTVRVCKSDGTVVTPYEPAGGPYTYTGAFTISPVAAPAVGAPGSTTNPTTVNPKPSYSTWNAKFAPATVVDPQRTEGEPLVTVDADGNLWESGPWGFSTSMSFIHRSTDNGRSFNLVSAVGARPDGPPGGGDSDVALDDQGFVYFADLEGALDELGVSVSNDGGHNWRKNPAAVQQTIVDRQWLAIDNGPTTGSGDNTVFLSFHTTAVGTFVYSAPGSSGPNDQTGGLVFQNAKSLPGPVDPVAGDATRAQLRYDPFKRNLYYACKEKDHVRVSVAHVLPGQRTGLQFANYNGPKTPGGGDLSGLFPAMAVDKAGNVYIAWIDGTTYNLYYSFSKDEGKTWSAAVKVNNGSAVTNEFDWAQAGASGKLALAWYATDVHQLSDTMPPSLDPAQADAATNYKWYGYVALISNAASSTPAIAQTRFTEKPMHYGAICNQGTLCAADTTADRTMADYFGFNIGKNGGLQIVYNDTTNEFDGAGLYSTRQVAGSTITGGSVSDTVQANPASDRLDDAQYPHYSPAGPGQQQPQLDLTNLRVSNLDANTLRFRMTVKDASQLVPPPGKTSSIWLTRFQALAPRPGGTANVYRIFYVFMEKKLGVVPSFYAGTATCQGTTPNSCKIFQYRGEVPAAGTIVGNTITIDVGINTGFGAPILSKRLYNMTAFTFGRNVDYDDLYADVDSTPGFDYDLGTSKG